tara:strand:+ start:3305 stop:3484 length:180 start_codon:yes stop_codon:yes gene_type:complete
MKKILLIITLICFFGCEQSGTHYRCSAGNPGIFPTPSGCIESENGEFETMEACQNSCKY